MDNILFRQIPEIFRKRRFLVFGCLWLLIFALYLPAARGGWVSDTVEALQRLKHGTFIDYISIKESRGNPYPFTQATTYLIYLLFGTNRWLWHLLFITVQAANATLLFLISLEIFDAAQVKNAFGIAAGSVVLFCVCPHISEVMVWKACYHYLQTAFMMLCIIYCVQKFHASPLAKYAWCAGILFLFSTLSDEYFFLTFSFVFTLIIYYRIALGYSHSIFKKALLYFILPLTILVVVHVATPFIYSGGYAANVVDEAHQSVLVYLRKPPLYLFHTIFFGRFFPADKKQWIYDFLSAKSGLIIFYAAFICTCLYVFIRFHKMAVSGKAMVLIFLWMLLSIAMVTPVWISETLWVNFDRYTYFMLPFIYMLLLFFLSKLLPDKPAIFLFAVYALMNVYFTLRVNKCWYYSARIVDHIMHAVPPADDKIILMLNSPEYMKGVPMVGPFLHFSFRQMYNLYNERQINNTMYDVISYNMSSKDDGAHVTVINDSVLHVTLNQWGTWWWDNLWGAHSYENKDFKFNLIDPGHWYELTLKHPASHYLLLYQVGEQLKTADMDKRNQDQY